jgi:hypothetical protein
MLQAANISVKKFCKFLIGTSFENFVGIYRKQKFLPEFAGFFCWLC